MYTLALLSQLPSTRHNLAHVIVVYHIRYLVCGFLSERILDWLARLVLSIFTCSFCCISLPDTICDKKQRIESAGYPFKDCDSEKSEMNGLIE